MSLRLIRGGRDGPAASLPDLSPDSRPGGCLLQLKGQFKKAFVSTIGGRELNTYGQTLPAESKWKGYGRGPGQILNECKTKIRSMTEITGVYDVKSLLIQKA